MPPRNDPAAGPQTQDPTALFSTSRWNQVHMSNVGLLD
jgi:hypothetical protein